MQTKAMMIEEMGDAGKGLARIATLSAVDSDGDTYAPGAFGEQWAPILVAHNRSMVPVGKARVYEEGDAAYAELHVNLDMQAGRDWHAALKFDLAKGDPVQEWSYGYDTLDADYQIRPSGRVRVLKQLKVAEVSTVVQGAGERTRTLAMKGLSKLQLKEQHFAPLIASLGELGVALDDDLSALSAQGVKQLAEIRDGLISALTPIEAKAASERVGGDTVLAQFLLLSARGHLPR